MASIEKRRDADGAVVGWRVRWREVAPARAGDPPGLVRRVARSRQFDTKRLGEEFLKQAERCERLGLRWEPPAARQEPDVREVVVDYLTDRARSLSPASLEAYGAHLNVLEQFLGPRWNRPFREVFTRAVLAEFWAWLGDPNTTRRGVARAATTQNKILSVVQLVWAWADEHGDYGDTVPRPRRIDLPTPAAPPTTAPTWAQMDAALALLDERHRRLCTILRCTGLRRSQGRRLLWSDFDIEGGTLTIRGEIGKSKQERQGRVMPIAPVLAAELAGWGVREGLVCPGALDYDQVHRAWEGAGVSPNVHKSRPLHGFRKGFVSGVKALGADPEAVEFLMGHSLGLSGTYTAAWALKLREAVEMVPVIGGESSTVVSLKRGRG